MNTQPDLKYELLSRASAYQCRACPPNRVFTWNCIQGASMADIVIGASLATESNSPAVKTGQTKTREALWNLYNRGRRR